MTMGYDVIRCKTKIKTGVNTMLKEKEMSLLRDLLHQAIRSEQICIYDHETKVIWESKAEVQSACFNGNSIQITMDTRR